MKEEEKATETKTPLPGVGVEPLVTPSEFLDRLTDFLGDSEGMTTEEVKAELREEGIDVDGIVERGKQMVNEMIKVKQNIKNEESQEVPLCVSLEKGLKKLTQMKRGLSFEQGQYLLSYALSKCTSSTDMLALILTMPD